MNWMKAERAFVPCLCGWADCQQDFAIKLHMENRQSAVVIVIRTQVKSCDMMENIAAMSLGLLAQCMAVRMNLLSNQNNKENHND